MEGLLLGVLSVVALKAVESLKELVASSMQAFVKVVVPLCCLVEKSNYLVHGIWYTGTNSIL